MSIWFSQFCNAAAEYSTIWVVERWYFAEYEDEETERKVRAQMCVMVFGWFHGVFYHPGSLALNSFVLAFFRPAYYISQCSKSTRACNPVISCILVPCICCCQS